MQTVQQAKTTETVIQKCMHLHSRTHARTAIALLFSPWQSAQEIKCNSYPFFFCETKCFAQVSTKINKEWNIIIDFLRVFLQRDPGI